MVTETGLSVKRSLLFLLAGILIFVVYLHFFVGIPTFLDIIKTVNLVYYGFAVVFLVLSMFFGALAWQYLLRPLSVKVSFRKVFLFNWIGSFVDLLVPAESIGGDVAKVYLLSKEPGATVGKLVASVVGQRILSILMTLGSLVFGSVVLYTVKYDLPASVLNLVLLITVGTVFGLLFILLCVLKKGLALRMVGALFRFAFFVTRGRLRLDGLRAKALEVLESFYVAMGDLLRNPKTLVLPILFSLVSWMLSIFVSSLVFVSLGQQVDFVLITIVYSVSVNIQSIPLGVPGAVGIVEVVMSSLYGLLGVEAGVAAAATVLIRLLWVWMKLVVGFVTVQYLDLKNLAEKMRQSLF